MTTQLGTEVGDVAEGRYDWWTDRGRGGISLWLPTIVNKRCNQQS